MCSRLSPGSANRQPACRSWSNATWKRLASTFCSAAATPGVRACWPQSPNGYENATARPPLCDEISDLVVVEVGADARPVLRERLARLHAHELRRAGTSPFTSSIERFRP